MFKTGGYLLFTAAIFAAPLQGTAAEWAPQKNVEILVGTAAGGAQDKTARTIQSILQNRRLTEATTSVVNKPGAAGGLALSYLNQHAGDSHYLLVSSSTLISNQLMGKTSVGLNDVVPIAQLFLEYTTVAVRTDGPIKSGKDLLDRLRADPESMSIGITALGTEHHIGIVQACISAGLETKPIKFVVFPSGAQALTALLGGHIDAVATSVSNVVPHMTAGRLRVLAVAAPLRLTGDAAAIPTWKEQGADSIAANFRGIAAPKGTSEEQVRYWEEVFARFSKNESWIAALQKEFWVNTYLNSADSRKYLQAQYARLREVLATLGIGQKIGAVR